MGVTFGGKPCLAPEELALSCGRLEYPTAPWLGRANSFVCPLGQTPGRGWLLLLRRHLDDLGLTTSRDLVFDDDLGSRVTVKSLLPLRAFAATPGARGDKDTACWLEITDKRHLAVATVIDKAYNVRSSPGGGYYSATLNGGSAWTWSQMTSDIWSAVGTTRLGDFPGLPFTPDGTPEGFTFYGSSAYTALGVVLERLGCALSLDPVADTFGIVRVGATDDTATAALTKRDGVRVWDDYSLSSNRGEVPEKVRVHFARQRATADTTGGSPWYTLDRTDPTAGGALAGVEAGTYAVLYDDLPAIVNSAGTVTNTTALGTRADERAADFYRLARLGRLHRVYSQGRTDAGLRPGKVISATSWEDRGRDGLLTEVSRFPGRLTPAALAGGATGPGGAGTGPGLGSGGGAVGFGDVLAGGAVVGSPVNVWSPVLLNQWLAGGGGPGGGALNLFASANLSLAILLQLLDYFQASYGGSSMASGRDWNYFRTIGTSPLERWYLGGQARAGALLNSPPVVGLIYAVPFVAPRGGTLDRLAFRVNTAGSGGDNAIAGIYDSTSDTNLYPNARVVLGTEQDVSTTGMKSSTINYALTAGKLYWLAFNAEAATQVLSAVDPANCFPLLGHDSDFATGEHAGITLEVSHTYNSSLPDPFPAGASVGTSLSTTYVPALGVRYSA